jgi:hypothetical protein
MDAERPLRLVGVGWFWHGDGSYRAEGAKGSNCDAGLGPNGSRHAHLDVPPEVTTGRVVVVVGGEVVVVLGGEVVVVVDADPDAVPGSDEVGGAVVVVDVVDVELAEIDVGLVLAEVLAPGCSLATTTPIAMAAPVATKAVERVNRRRRAAARRLVSGVLDRGSLLIGSRPRICIAPEKRRCLNPVVGLPVSIL